MQTEAFFKMITTITIWVILGAISVMVIIFSEGRFNGDTSMLTIFPLILAFLATIGIWFGKELFAGRSAQQVERETEKAKRDMGMSKLDLLMNMMDEDEREAFKETLKRRVLNEMRLSEDGELPYGADLMYEQDREKRLRR